MRDTLEYAMAAATEVVLAHPDVTLVADTRLALAGGFMLFVGGTGGTGGTGGALWRATGRLPVPRVILTLLCAAFVTPVGRNPLVALGILLVGLIAVALAESSQSHSHV